MDGGTRIIVDIGLLREAAQALSDIINADEGGEPYTGEGLHFAIDSYNNLTALVSKAEGEYAEEKEKDNGCIN